MKKRTKNRLLKLKKELRSMRINYFVLLGVYLLALIFIVDNQFFDKNRIVIKDIKFEDNSSNYRLAYARPLKINYTQIIFDKNISEDEKEDIQDILEEVNPLFYEYQRKITFTKDLCKYLRVFEECNEDISETTLGFNNRGGEIYITYLEDKDRLRRILCHELMHTYIYPTSSDNPNKDKLHAIVYTLGSQEVCFSSTGDFLADPEHFLLISE